MLFEAYLCTQEQDMRAAMEGIVAPARHHISSGRVEGTNCMIKTLRRAGYGYPDYKYFFLKIFDCQQALLEAFRGRRVMGLHTGFRTEPKLLVHGTAADFYIYLRLGFF
jgi:hypothetical protein